MQITILASALQSPEPGVGGGGRRISPISSQVTSLGVLHNELNMFMD